MKHIFKALSTVCAGLLMYGQAQASSHREAPLITMDPVADNTDVYAFRSPCDTSKVVIMANFIPFELPHGGPNWYTFGTDVHYDIHIKNQASGITDDITYRFTFSKANDDPGTFFNIRLGERNERTIYKVQRKMPGQQFQLILSGRSVPPPNIGPRSIDGPVGLNDDYDNIMMSRVYTAPTGEKVFAGPIDDPFFFDLGAGFDLGGFRGANAGRDGLAKYNVHTIAMEIPITTLQKDGKSTSQATSILDPEFVIGVWASAARREMSTLGDSGNSPMTSGTYRQVSRLGMPLTNEVIIPIGMKDMWNSTSPYAGNDLQYAQYLMNPELALYMDDSQFGTAVPGLAPLRIQSASRPDIIPGGFDFRNGHQGLWPLKGSAAVAGTALDDALFGTILLPNATSPRSVDILPIFFTGVPNLAPYQLATGKAGGNPLMAGKPFINNFLPTLGDMLRLNMAVPVTPRNSPAFSSLGIVAAAVAGLTDTAYTNHGTQLQFIPNMDGFPNGRRLEDDVATISLQAVSGVALAAIGLWYDDYNGTGSPVTTMLTNVLGFNAGVTHNDTTFKTCFPYGQTPWRGYRGDSYVGTPFPPDTTGNGSTAAGTIISTPSAEFSAYPNPFRMAVNFKYKLAKKSDVTIVIADISGRTIQTVSQGTKNAGEYTTVWNGIALPTGTYYARLMVNNTTIGTTKLTKVN